MRTLFIKVIILVVGLFLGISCEEGIDTAQPGSKWETAYVTLHPKNYLSPLKPITLAHSKGEGINYEFDFPFILKLSKPLEYDVVAELEIKHDLPVLNEKMVLSSRQLIVKAGEQQSEAVSLKISDWTDLEKNQDNQEYNLVIQVKNLMSQENDIALGDYYRDIKLLIVKQTAK